MSPMSSAKSQLVSALVRDYFGTAALRQLDISWDGRRLKASVRRVSSGGAPTVEEQNDTGAVAQ